MEQLQNSETGLLVSSFANPITSTESSLVLCLIIKLLFRFMIISKDLGKKSKVFGSIWKR